MHVVMLPGSVSRLAGGLFTSVRRLSASVEGSGGSKIDIVGHWDTFTSEDLAEWEPLVPSVLAKRGFGAGRELAAQLVQLKPDIIHRHFLWSYASIGVAKYTAREGRHCCTIVSPRGMLDPWALRHHRWKKRIAGFLFEDQSLHSAACLHALNESEAASMRAYGLKNPICVIPNGIDLPDLPENDITSRQTGNHGRKSLLFLGRIHSKKGLVPFLHGWSIARAQLSDWKLVIAGWDDGGHEATLKNLVRELKLESEVEFAGPQHGENKKRILSSCNAFTLPSFSEGLPMAVLEAWAYRLPVLMTNQCNLPVGFAENAAIQMEPTPESAAEGLLRIAQMSVEARTSMGHRGFDLVERHFTWTQIARSMLSVYQWVSGLQPQPDCVRTA